MRRDPGQQLTAVVEAYFADLRRLRASGGATGERSSYIPLANLLNAVGGSLKPKVFCIAELADQGSGHPDMGLYAAKQVRKGDPREGQIPERGVVEVKSVKAALGTSEVREQVNRYWSRYRLVLVTNLREFELVGRRSSGDEVRLETFSLAATEADFERLLERPRASAQKVGRGLGEYLARALSHRAALADPQDLAWLLASYARDGLERVERAGDSPSLGAVRSALEEALGFGSRARGEGGSSARPWCRRSSTACFPPGCCGRGRRRRAAGVSTGGRPFGICVRPSCGRSSSNLPIRDASGRSA
ncbi:MAG: hypothetical protein OXH70_17125 [Acidobacteria bacterium]|nr:hypothetical protein [Acidobacteriota bacterium]